MAIDEQRLRVRRSLEEKLGVEEASYLMDRPIGGWSELVTNHTLNHTLDLKFEVVDERFRSIDERFRSLDERLDAKFDAIAARFAVVDAQFVALRHDLRAEMERGFRRQTWALLGVLVPGFVAVVAALVAQSGG